jgi:predicted kinase
MAIVVVGLPGAGKSFFASNFAKTFGAALVSQDKIRWTLFAHHTYSDNENTIVGQVADLLITELLRTGKTFVLDGGYNSQLSRETLAERVSRHGFRILTIVVQVDQPTSKKRALGRNSNKPGDRYKQPLSATQFAAEAEQYEAPTVDKNTVVISGKHTYATQARAVLKKIVETRDTSTSDSRPKSIVGPRGPFIG